MRKKMSERVNPNKPMSQAFRDKMKQQRMLQLLKQMAELYKDNPEKLKVIHQWIRDLEMQSQPGYSIREPRLPVLDRRGPRKKPMYFDLPSQPGEIVSEAGNEFDGGTNTPPAPAGTPGKPRPGDAGIDLAEKIEDIKANSQVWTQSITNRIEDLVKAVASGDKRAARDLISDLKIDAREFIRYIADDAGVKPQQPKPQQPKPQQPKPQQPKPQQPSNVQDRFKKIVTSTANVKEAYAVRSGKRNIREAKPAAVKLAQRYNLTELKKLYNRAVNKRR